jgi:hypothetical protein
MYVIVAFPAAIVASVGVTASVDLPACSLTGAPCSARRLHAVVEGPRRRVRTHARTHARTHVGTHTHVCMHRSRRSHGRCAGLSASQTAASTIPERVGVRWAVPLAHSELTRGPQHRSSAPCLRNPPLSAPRPPPRRRPPAVAPPAQTTLRCRRESAAVCLSDRQTSRLSLVHFGEQAFI